MPKALLAEIPIVVKFKVKEDDPIRFKVTDDESVKFKIDSMIAIGGAERYEGEYVITPKAYDEQILETKDKIMSNDVVVLKVPKYETTNLSGGYTVYIAEE